MISIVCQHENRKKNGTTKGGAVRFRCKDCGKSWTETTAKLGGMRIGMDKAEQIIRCLCAGNSVSSAATITGCDPHTIIDLMVMVGEKCQTYMEENIKGVAVEDIQCDEIWQFVLCKRATAKREKMVGGCGDSYCYTAIERGTKLVVAWHMGRRNEQHTDTFAKKLANATAGRFHLSTDGFSCYPMAMWMAVGQRVDYGMLVKIFREGGAEDRRKYSPARIIGSKRSRVFGIPDGKKICTSHSERLNGSIRNYCKRMGRLTYCFSKKWANHRAALGLFFAHYNWCRAHKTLKGQTPAMAHGIANHRWTVRELLENVLAA